MVKIKEVGLRIIIFIMISILVNNLVCLAKVNSADTKKILIVGSYSVDNAWERDVIKGFTENIGENNIIKIEFLDSKVSTSVEYDNSFIHLLNLKYDKSLDYILTLDDEAFKLIRQNLFNKDLFTYKKNIMFAGVNENTTVSKEEGQYITGILEEQDNLLMINTILGTDNEIDNIFLLSDNSIYSYTVENNLRNLINEADRTYKLNIIKGAYFQDIEEEIKNINNENSAILICGTYKNSNSNEIVSEKEVINKIKELTKAPIYTKLEQYIEAGAIGGIINDGYKLGIMAATVLKGIISGNNIYTTIPPHDTFNIPMFNFRAVREYNINPLKLPSNSIFINKKPYELILPKYMVVIIYIFFIACIVGLSILIYLFEFNRKSAKEKNLLLVESIEREKIRTDFIVTISHELRTPINIIINATNLLKIKLDKDDIDPKFFYEKLSFIMKNTNRLRRYINNLIDVSKLEMGYMDANFSNENIVSVVEEATLTIVDLAKKFNIEVIFDTEEEEIIIAVDREKIERVILNLLSNSIKFTPDGGSIFVLVKRNENNVIIEVSDNGIGMREDVKNHVFEKFKRADLDVGLHRHNEGSGLGLFIVKGLIELHHGTITIESELNKGTKFIISLPISIVDSSKKVDFIGETDLEYLFDMELSDIDRKE